MELREAIRTRRSIRKFKDLPVEEGLIRQVIADAMLAPSAGNQQPWHFIIVTERGKLDRVPEFHPYCKMISKAPAAIVLCGEVEGKKWPTFWVQDCSAAAQNLLLSARDLGLGTVWAGVYPEEDRMTGARELFNIPEAIMPFAIIPIGWPDADFKAMDRYNEKVVHLNSWG